MPISKKEALEYHMKGRPGKIEVVPTKTVATQRDLALAYSPGVADPCLEIHSNPDDVFKYTIRGNLVAVITNGTAVLGLGNIGPLAAKPVMEGKGVLFKKFAGIDVFDIEIATEDPNEVIRFCELIEPTVGGINLEDIAAPACFEIERILSEKLDIPVFHDDQHGTAIITAAALINAVEVVGKKMETVQIVFNGAGASALSTAEHLCHVGVKLDNILMCDSKGVIYEGREDLTKYKAPFAAKTSKRTLKDVMVGADVFIGLSVKGAVSKEMVGSMATDPIIFSLANPDPEILPEEVLAVRNDAVIATGRSDYPNQVNNVLGFPFIFRGALDVRAKGINKDMMLAATYALAELAREQVPDMVRGVYEDPDISFGREYLIPKPFDHRVLFHVAPAVAKAAMETGIASLELDLDDYREQLRASLGPGREVMRWMTESARKSSAKIVFPEGHNDSVIQAVAQMAEDGICEPILLGRPPRVREKAKLLGVDLTGIEIVHAAACTERRYEFAETLFEQRARRGLTLAEAQWNLYKPVYFAASMLAAGEVDAMVAGIEANYAEILRPALQVIGKADGVSKVSGLYMLAFPGRELLLFADTTVNIDPGPETLRDIALQTATFARYIGIRPRVAMVSFSNFSSNSHEESRQMAAAVELVREADPELEIDGEMQADTAIDEIKLREVYPFTRLTGPANILVFSRLSAANVAYKLLDRLGGADVIGPVLLGMAKPAHILQRGCSVQDIINLATVAAVDSQARNNQI